MKSDTIYYDGHCALCHGFVNFVLARDKAAHFRFAPLDRLNVLNLPDSVVVRSGNELRVKSDAALYVLEQLGGVWKVLASAARFFPTPIRDFVYDRIAQVRYRIFGRKTDSCPVIPKELRSRFDL